MSMRNRFYEEGKNWLQFIGNEARDGIRTDPASIMKGEGVDYSMCSDPAYIRNLYPNKEKADEEIRKMEVQKEEEKRYYDELSKEREEEARRKRLQKARNELNSLKKEMEETQKEINKISRQGEPEWYEFWRSSKASLLEKQENDQKNSNTLSKEIRDLQRKESPCPCSIL